MSVLSKYDPIKPGNFWELNSEFITIPIYRKIYDNDKSKKKEKSSKWMWGIAHFVEREDNRFAKRSEEDKKNLISKDIIGESTRPFPWDKWQDVIDYWLTENKTALERHLDAMYIYLDKRTKVIEEATAELTLENMEEVDKAVNRTTAIEDRISKLQEKVKAEQEETGTAKGSKKLSARERNLF